MGSLGTLNIPPVSIQIGAYNTDVAQNVRIVRMLNRQLLNEKILEYRKCA